jgi:hypothetical protein
MNALRYPEVLVRLSGPAEAHMQPVFDGTVPETEGTAMPEEVVARLRALGYLDRPGPGGSCPSPVRCA